MSLRNCTISAVVCSILSLSVLRCFLLCVSVSPLYLRKLLRKVVFKNHFTRLVLTLHTFQFSHVLGESPLSHLQMFTPVCFTSISILPSSSGFASSCRSSNYTDCFFRSHLLDFESLVSQHFPPWSTRLCTPAHGLVHHTTKRTPTACEHSLWTNPAHASHATLLECRFCINETWNLDQTWFSDQNRQYHSFMGHLARQKPIPLLRLKSISLCTVNGLH